MQIFAENLDPEQIAPVWPKVRKGIMERIDMCETGRLHAPKWFEKRLHEIDPLLTLRWDFLEECYVVDRWTRSERCYTTILVWKDEHGPKHLDGSLLQALHDADTWRFPNWKAYLDHKHEQGKKRRAQIKKEGDEKVREAIDSLTQARAKNFMEVEQAFHSGETVVFHGESERTLERMYDGAAKAAAQGEAIGPPPHTLLRPKAFEATIKAENEARDKNKGEISCG